MTNEEYLQTQHAILMVAAVAQDLPLAAFIERAEAADALGPILDPTLYLSQGQNLESVLTIARALLPFQSAVLATTQRDDQAAAKAKGPR